MKKLSLTQKLQYIDKLANNLIIPSINYSKFKLSNASEQIFVSDKSTAEFKKITDANGNVSWKKKSENSNEWVDVSKEQIDSLSRLGLKPKEISANSTDSTSTDSTTSPPPNNPSPKKPAPTIQLTPVSTKLQNFLYQIYNVKPSNKENGQLGPQTKENLKDFIELSSLPNNTTPQQLESKLTNPNDPLHQLYQNTIAYQNNYSPYQE